MLQGYVTTAEAARICEEAEHTVRKRIANGELKATKVGMVWLIPLSEVKALSNAQKSPKNGS